MRILRVAQKLYPGVKGGGPYHVHAMSRDQAAMGHDVTVLTVDDGSGKPHVEERDGYTVIRYPSTAALLGNDVSIGIGEYLLAVEGFDVVHAHSHLYFSTNLAAMRRRLSDVPLAITNHGLYSQTAPEWLFDLYLRSVGRWTLNQADAVFCYTEAEKRRLRAFDVTTRIDVIPNGIDTKRFAPEGERSGLITHDGPVVLFVGRLVEGKRPADAVAAVERVRDELGRPDVKLYVCGRGPLHGELKDGTGDHIEFLGHVAYDEMPRIYRSADTLVLPSRAEGLPRTVLEAMASGIGVVASDLEQVAALIDGYGSGYIASTGDIEGFAEGIERTLDADGSDTSEEAVSRDIAWQRTVGETTDALRRLADGYGW